MCEEAYIESQGISYHQHCFKQIFQSFYQEPQVLTTIQNDEVEDFTLLGSKIDGDSLIYSTMGNQSETDAVFLAELKKLEAKSDQDLIKLKTEIDSVSSSVQMEQFQVPDNTQIVAVKSIDNPRAKKWNPAKAKNKKGKNIFLVSPEQRSILRQTFKYEQFPSGHTIQRLTFQTRLSENQVRCWFIDERSRQGQEVIDQNLSAEENVAQMTISNFAEKPQEDLTVKGEKPSDEDYNNKLDNCLQNVVDEQSKMFQTIGSFLDDILKNEISDENSLHNLKTGSGLPTLTRHRSRYGPERCNILMNEFEKNEFPSKNKRHSLGQLLGLTDRKVQIWFQNMRRKKKSNSNHLQSPN